MKYRAEIDGLRALAVLPVILFHAGFEWFSGGFVGVDVFFVISGYLITTIIISEMAEGKFSIVNFYERRARRILPALFFVMAACLPFAWLWLTPSYLRDFGQSLVAVSTFSSNILFWLESGYFNTAAELKPLLHTWSLAVEEQYYILFPIFLMLTWRLGIKWILILLSIVFFISLGIAQWGAYNNPSAAFFLLPTRGWELLIGVFASFYLNYNPHLKSHSLNQALSLLGFGMIVYSILIFDETTPFPSLYTLIPTIGTGLLILCAVPKTLVHNLLSLKFVVGVGLISYSAYLWHQPLLAFVRHRLLGDVPDIVLIILCGASLVMAWGSWKFVEAPFRNKEILNRKSIYSISLLGIISFVCIGMTFHFSNGFPIDRGLVSIKNYQSLKEESFQKKISLSQKQDCYNNQKSTIRFEGYCYLNEENLIFGDSHAFDAASSIELHGEKNVSRLAGGGCSLIPLKSHSYCNINFDAFKEAYENKILRKVFLFNRYDDGELTDEYLEKVFSYWGAYESVEIFVMSPIPEFPSYMAITRKDEVNKHFNKISFDKEDRFFRLVGDLKLPKNIKIIRLSDYTCPNKGKITSNLCYFNKDGVYYYTDNDHLGLAGMSEYGKNLHHLIFGQ